ncbi:NAD(P)/FAD-dependent oxidoreductase, partial [Candidatus Sumerlaeota bacterium]|nr:NAD(P)/FAD-dependent oxidoreductase [Candidatus Sumerlaeota bacterium]
GPAGLAAAHAAIESGYRCTVLEKDDCVGGIARTINYKGYLFDIGGHRFFTKNREVNDFWHDILKDDFIRVNRLSRIYYNGKFFHYPLKPWNAFRGLGPIRSFHIFLSYLNSRIAPCKEENSFEEWVTNRFGKVLYRTFFKTYTEKVWGIPCSRIEAEWASQRIKGLSLFSAVKNALFQGRGNRIKTLIPQFHYPREGPGMLYQRLADKIREKGGRIEYNAEATAIHHEKKRVTEVSVVNPATGEASQVEGDYFLSSMPLTRLAERLVPSAPPDVLDSCSNLHYRAILVVNLVIEIKDLFPDNWIYAHSPEVRVGRLQNYKNWSRDMIKTEPERYTSIGMEYFCNEGDDLWNTRDDILISDAGEELKTLGLLPKGEHRIIDGFIVRMPYTYCIYELGYKKYLEIIKEGIRILSNLQPIGRAGMFKYNNMDHSILTGFLGVRNIQGGKFDLWNVNVEREYHEEASGDAD